MNIPKTEFAIIGGSGTWAGEFPESSGFDGVSVLEKNLTFDTPFGACAPMKFCEIAAGKTSDGTPRRFLTVPFHGFSGLGTENNPSEKVFWVLREAGVRVIVVEGSGGSVNTLLDPGDIIIPHDFIDLTKRPSMLHRFTENIVRMAEPCCAYLRSLLYVEAKKEYPRVFPRGVYACDEGPRFESATEVRMLRAAGADLCALSLVPEVYLARAIGACYAGVYLVSNYAEGVEDPGWKGSSIFDHYAASADRMGRITLGAIAAWDREKAECRCRDYIIQVPQNVKNNINHK